MPSVLIVGRDSFTGSHLDAFLSARGYEVYGTVRVADGDPRHFPCDITAAGEIHRVIKGLRPDYVIHLAGISFVAHEPAIDFYQVNVLGAEQVLLANRDANPGVKKILLASSSVVYGNQRESDYHEGLVPDPVNHYGISKYAMEQMAKTWMAELPLLVVRPFNYTGVGQSNQFLVPKIVQHYCERKPTIELGNLDVQRELNDVRYVCEIYARLLESPARSEIVNLSSGRAVHLRDILGHMNRLAGYDIRVEVNPAFVRRNEIPVLRGSPEKLYRLVGQVVPPPLEKTLEEMYRAGCRETRT